MWVFVLVFAVVLGTFHAVRGDWWTALATVAFLAALSWWTSPWRGGRRATSRAEALASGRDVVVYWRPGCPWCERLRRGVGRAGADAAWVDIWRDDEAAAFVRGVNDGNETVPTVVIAGVAHTNPDPALVREALSR